MFDRKKYKKFAKAQLKNRWGIAILVSFLIFAINNIFQIPSTISFLFSDAFNTLASNPSVSPEYALSVFTAAAESTPWLVSLIQTLVTVIFTFGAIKVYILMTRSPEPVKFGTFLEGLNYWGKAILSLLWMSLWLFIWGLIPGAVTSVAVALVTVLSINNTTAVVVVAAVIGIVAVIASFILLVSKSYSYSLMYYIAVEHKNVSVTKALNMSKILTKGNKWNLFVIDLSFIGWAILAIIPAGIGFIFLNPYMYLTKLNAYHAILQESIEKGTIKPEDFTE